MNKNVWIAILMALLMIVAVEEVIGEEAIPFAAEREQAIAVVQAANPDAVIDYAVRERDDRRWEWNVFFMQNGVLGMAKVLEEGFELRRVELFNQTREDSLTASAAMEKLALDKGPLTVTDLELDWDDGWLSYEGEAEKNGSRYEFEMSVDGRIIEWERD